MIIQLLRSLGKSDRDKARALPGYEASEFVEGDVYEVPAKFGEPLIERGLATVLAAGRVVPVQFARTATEPERPTLSPKQPTVPDPLREPLPAQIEPTEPEAPAHPPTPTPAKVDPKADPKTAKQNPAK